MPLKFFSLRDAEERLESGGTGVVGLLHTVARYSRSTPGEFDGGLDVGMEAFVNGAGVGSAFEFQLVFGGDGVRHVDFDGKAFDHAWGGGGHFLFDGGGGPGDIDFQGAGHDAHDGEHAGAERGGDEVGGREAFAAALVVLGGIGIEFGSGGAMHGFAVQVSLIFDLDGDHVVPLAIQRNLWAEADAGLCDSVHRTYV